jgi:hypothetical protein
MRVPVAVRGSAARRGVLVKALAEVSECVREPAVPRMELEEHLVAAHRVLQADQPVASREVGAARRGV